MSSVSPIRFLLPLLATLVAGLLAGPQAAQAVVSGSAGASVSKANDGEYPWTVAIVERDGTDQSQFCGGTLIALDRVLTAAHCIDPAGPNQATADSIDVLVGQASLAARGCLPGQCNNASETARVKGLRRQVAQISLHRLADIKQEDTETDHLYYDMAILTLAQPLPAEPYERAIVQPVASSGEFLPSSSGNPDAWGARAGNTPGVFTYVSGWGKTSESAASAPNVMRFGGGSTMERLADPTCASRYPGQFRSEDMLCVGLQDVTALPGIDACQGDSGGPLLTRVETPLPPTLTQADANGWAIDVFGAAPESGQAFSPAQRATIEQAKAASGRQRVGDDVVAGWSSSARSDIDADTALKQQWEDQIRAALTDEERNGGNADAIVAARLSDRIDVEVNAITDFKLVVGTTSQYGFLYLRRQADELAARIASYAKEGANWRLVGVVSWGVGCGRRERPGVYARVGAPALRAYVTSPAPAVMPHLVSAAAGPTVSGTFSAGETLTCQPGSWVGATEYTYTLWRDNDGDGQRTGSDAMLTNRQTYKVGIGDVSRLTATDLASGVSVGCTVQARGEGGYATFSGAVSRIAAPKLSPPVGTDPPPTVGVSPTPTPTTAPVGDRVGPALAKKAAVCSKSSCRVSIVALDKGVGATGMKGVTAVLTIVRKTKCRATSGKYKGKLRPCVKTTRKSVALSHGGDQWVAKVKGLRKGDRTTIRFTGVDLAGNRSVIAIGLKIRTSR